MNLILGNAFEVLPTIEPKSIDMILTDPPYKISNSGGGMMERGNRDFIKQIDSMGMCNGDFNVPTFLSLLIPLFNNKQYFNGVFFCSRLQILDYLTFATKNKFQYGITMWHKSDPTPLCNNKYLNDIEFAVYIKGNKARIGGSYATKSLVYSSSTNRKDKREYGHPTIKPVKLIEKYLVNHTKDNMVVCDPFMGSGTTGVACKKLNRDFIGVELDEKYFNIAKARINNTIVKIEAKTEESTVDGLFF